MPTFGTIILTTLLCAARLFEVTACVYPHVPGLGLGSGIRDKFGHELEFPSAFRQSRRDGKPRGIVKIKYEGPS